MYGDNIFPPFHQRSWELHAWWYCWKISTSILNPEDRSDGGAASRCSISSPTPSTTSPWKTKWATRWWEPLRTLGTQLDTLTTALEFQLENLISEAGNPVFRKIINITISSLWIEQVFNLSQRLLPWSGTGGLKVWLSLALKLKGPDSSWNG